MICMQTSVYEIDDPYRRLCQVRACAIEAAHGIAAGVLIWRYGTTVGARAGAKHESSGARACFQYFLILPNQMFPKLGQFQKTYLLFHACHFFSSYPHQQKHYWTYDTMATFFSIIILHIMHGYTNSLSANINVIQKFLEVI